MVIGNYEVDAREIDKIYDRLDEVFQDVFDDEDIRVDYDTTSDDIEDWDSMEHITLINAVEREFRMKFKVKEVSSMKNVGEMVKIIAVRSKTVKKIAL